jgi:hypothetical protein
MAALSYFMNDKTMRAWPGYDLLAEVTGDSEDTIDRSIRKLKATSYLRTARHAPITGGRALVHYGYGKIDPGFLDNLIEDAVAKIKARRADSAQKVGVRPTPTKIPESDIPTPTFSSIPDSDILSPQEPIKYRNPDSEVFANESSLASETKLSVVEQVKPPKRKSRATGKRPWEWVHESEKRDLLERCREFAEQRGWSQAFLSERLRAFAQFQSSRRIVSADWWAELELWLGNALHQPRSGSGKGENRIETAKQRLWGAE